MRLRVLSDLYHPSFIRLKKSAPLDGRLRVVEVDHPLEVVFRSLPSGPLPYRVDHIMQQKIMPAPGC